MSEMDVGICPKNRISQKILLNQAFVRRGGR